MTLPEPSANPGYPAQFDEIHICQVHPDDPEHGQQWYWSRHDRAGAALRAGGFWSDAEQATQAGKDANPDLLVPPPHPEPYPPADYGSDFTGPTVIVHRDMSTQ